MPREVKNNLKEIVFIKVWNRDEMEGKGCEEEEETNIGG